MIYPLYVALFFEFSVFVQKITKKLPLKNLLIEKINSPIGCKNARFLGKKTER